jgi:hypothetical protein
MNLLFYFTGVWSNPNRFDHVLVYANNNGLVGTLLRLRRKILPAFTERVK